MTYQGTHRKTKPLSRRLLPRLAAVVTIAAPLLAAPLSTGAAHAAGDGCGSTATSSSTVALRCAEGLLMEAVGAIPASQPGGVGVPVPVVIGQGSDPVSEAVQQASDCLTQTDPTCASVVRVVDQQSQSIEATILSCAGGTNEVCNQARGIVTGEIAAVLAFGTQCAAGQDPTCATLLDTISQLVDGAITCLVGPLNPGAPPSVGPANSVTCESVKAQAEQALTDAATTVATCASAAVNVIAPGFLAPPSVDTLGCGPTTTLALGIVQSAEQIAQSCQQGGVPACNTAQGLVASAIHAAAGCAAGSTPPGTLPGIANPDTLGCGAEVAAAQALAGGLATLLEQCVGGTNGTCNLIVQTVEGVVGLVVGTVAGCTGSGSTCATLISTVENEASIVEALVADQSPAASCAVGNGAPYPDASNPDSPDNIQSCLPLDATVVDDGGFDTAPVMNSVSVRAGVPAGALCDESWTYKVTKTYATQLRTTFIPQSDYNGTNANIEEEFGSTSGSAVSWSDTASFSVSGGVSFSVIQAGINSTTGYTIQQDWTTSVQNSVRFQVPPKTWGDGKFGVFRVVTDGDYIHTNRYCGVTDYGNVRVYGPVKQGWYIYLSKNG